MASYPFYLADSEGKYNVSGTGAGPEKVALWTRERPEDKSQIAIHARELRTRRSDAAPPRKFTGTAQRAVF